MTIYTTNGWIPKEFNVLELELNYEYDMYINKIPPSNSSKKIIYLDIFEPPSSIPNEQNLERHLDKINLVFTKYSNLLNKYPNKCFYHPFAVFDSNIDLYKNYCINKDFSVSFLLGASIISNSYPGYTIRKNFWDNKDKITVKKIFYAGKRTHDNIIKPEEYLPNNNRDMLFKSMFHIAIENQPSENCFTEKIIDCFLSKTVPIYIGCTNIEKHFDINGILVAKNINDIINLSNNISEDLYYNMTGAIEKNYEIAKKCTLGNLVQEIKK